MLFVRGSFSSHLGVSCTGARCKAQSAESALSTQHMLVLQARATAAESLSCAVPCSNTRSLCCNNGCIMCVHCVCGALCPACIPVYFFLAPR